jgi:quercetin dioxygenase-like cupin family protein
MAAWFRKPVVSVLALVVAFGLGTAVGQQSPPKENKGMAVDKIVVRDLGGEIDGVQGRQLRLRLISLEPGGIIGIHSHKDRPAVAYVMHGTLTEHREDGTIKEHPKGDAWSEGKESTHWAENKGKTPVLLLAADVFKP